MLHGRHWGTGGRRSLEVLANILQSVVNFIGTALEVLCLVPCWRRRPTTAPVLPEDAAHKVIEALKADEGAARHLPEGWRGFYSNLVDEASQDIVARVPTGARLRLILGHEPYPVEVELADRPTARIGHLPRHHHFGDSIDRGQALCWFARRERMLLGGNASLVFVALYVP